MCGGTKRSQSYLWVNTSFCSQELCDSEQLSEPLMSLSFPIKKSDVVEQDPVPQRQSVGLACLRLWVPSLVRQKLKYLIAVSNTYFSVFV